MSAINDALSKLAEQHTEQAGEEKRPFVRAKVEAPKPRPSRTVWAILGFTVSLGVGAWAISTGNQENYDNQVSAKQSSAKQLSAKQLSNKQLSASGLPANASNGTLANQDRAVDTTTQAQSANVATEKPTSSNVKVNQEGGVRIADNNVPVTTRVTESDAMPIYSNEPVKVAPESSGQKAPAPAPAKTSTQPRANTTPRPVKGSLKVEQVQLSNYDLAEKSTNVAEKFLENNQLNEAISAYEQALRYTPKDENTRRKLAALYYGAKLAQKAGQTLETGIRLNPNSSALRLAYADILRKERQPDAALSVLTHLPPNPTVEYLAMRAALAQQLQRQEIAYNTYQLLTQRDPSNARWWLGYGMQQESYNQYAQAKVSYQKSLTLLGLSAQSQAYVNSRLSFIDTVTEGDN